MKKLVIIGGGPAGLNLALKTAKRFSTTVYEEHAKIGIPVQCSGIITDSIHSVLPEIKKDLHKAVLTRVKHANIFAPNKKHFELNFKKPDMILQRDKFDQLLASKAKKAGAEVLTNHKLIDIKGDKLIILNKKTKKKKQTKADFLVGADGPNSTVARLTGLKPKNTEFYTAVQAKIKLFEKRGDHIDFYPYIRDIAWVLPESDRVVGVGAMKRSNVLLPFKEFLKRFKGKILEVKGGLIPVYNPNQRIEKKRTFLVGDAATQVKATTGGGIMQALQASNILANTLDTDKSYERECRDLTKELKIHLRIRKALDRFSLNDWDNLINDCQDPTMKDILGTISRDQTRRIALNTITKKPGMIKYAIKALG
jgi:geranylgeranyl reductase family protein